MNYTLDIVDIAKIKIYHAPQHGAVEDVQVVEHGAGHQRSQVLQAEVRDLVRGPEG